MQDITATTRARRAGDVFYLTGQKRFVVGAEGADLILVYGKVEGIDDPKAAMTAFLVERGPGLEVQHVYGLMGTRGGGTGRLVFRDAPVSLENVLGPSALASEEIWNGWILSEAVQKFERGQCSVEQFATMIVDGVRERIADKSGANHLRGRFWKSDRLDLRAAQSWQPP